MQIDYRQLSHQLTKAGVIVLSLRYFSLVQLLETFANVPLTEQKYMLSMAMWSFQVIKVCEKDSSLQRRLV